MEMEKNMCFLHNNGKVTHLEGTNPDWSSIKALPGKAWTAMKNRATTPPTQFSSSRDRSTSGSRARASGQTPAWQRWMNMANR
jgi:hypothetical protein